MLNSWVTAREATSLNELQKYPTRVTPAEWTVVQVG